MKLSLNNISQVDWQKMDDLVPAIVQDATSGTLLMQGYMNKVALETTFEKGLVTFFSRSKQRLWTKGETSNNTLELVSAHVDCDNDSILVLANPNGPTCHKGTESCWQDSEATPTVGFIADLERVIASRKGADADSSYTASLYASGIKRIAQKVGEEGVETALAATVKDLEELKNESADLLYHLLVLLQASDLSLNDVIDVLKKRHQK
ncbi:bifunctional phosphoribosyl-AMP cyclohydrolase/phosphoribosyl-ATP diphosphatase HisIE [Psychrosphaera aestuarii]|uniref:bifunctional phosphoribosyl-AMP cyclohydrolase/phosphoribosyl-ATP diphosphatase HisIE n=1 Tax=Psychrosphaera aestuarii TaxID=1266052 RepID=UPI001B318C20|nr:bifunctional phosphoribosyl-AMP cyclohydrolase/phosphoribosyl-ATP diphosphatase HisIE [Psychrosphaera aestuarii]